MPVYATNEWEDLPQGGQRRIYAQTPEPKPPTQEQLAEADRTRLARRKALRKRLVESQLWEAEMNAKAREIQAAQAAADVAVAEHQAETAPIQQALEALRERRRAALIAGKQPAANIAAQEAIEHEKLHAANERLTQSAERSKRLLARLEAERYAAAKQVESSSLLHQFRQTADPKKLAALQQARTHAAFVALQNAEDAVLLDLED